MGTVPPLRSGFFGMSLQVLSYATSCGRDLPAQPVRCHMIRLSERIGAPTVPRVNGRFTLSLTRRRFGIREPSGYPPTNLKLGARMSALPVTWRLFMLAYVRRAISAMVFPYARLRLNQHFFRAV